MYARRRQPNFPGRARERGVILLLALIFLVLLTLLAIGASSGSLLQQRMVSATRSAQLATMSGDTALRGAEWHVWSVASVAGGHLVCLSGSLSATDACVNYEPDSSLYQPGGAVYQFRLGDNAWLPALGQKTYMGPNNAEDYTNQAAKYVTANLARNPQYIIEDLGRMLPPGAGPQHESGDTGPMMGGPGNINIHVFRITARATGGNQNTVRVVQSTFDAQGTN